MTTCEYDGTVKSYNCQREEQCDDCFMVDHQAECDWCEFYDHTMRRLEVKHLPSDYPKATQCWCEKCETERIEALADQEQKWGEERVSDN